LNEKEWIKEVKKRLEKEIFFKDTNLSFYDGRNYSFEIISYKDNEPEETNPIKYETDLIICQNLSENEWKPRIIIEGKLNSVTTHDAITYSQKAAIQSKSCNTYKCSSFFEIWKNRWGSGLHI